MKLKSISITNYRCFRHYHLNIAPQTTIIIGRNGAGKTTILNALKKALTVIFAPKNGNPIISEDSKLKIQNFDTADFYYKNGSYSKDLCLSANAVIIDKTINWELYQESVSSRLEAKKYFDALSEFALEYKKTKAFTIIAAYSDTFSYNDKKLSEYENTSVNKDILPKVLGYNKVFDTNGSVNVWQKRFVKAIFNRKVSNLWNREYLFVLKKMQFFSAILNDDGKDYTISDMYIDDLSNSLSLMFKFANNEKISFENLPSGYKRLYSIALDIAYRQYALNGSTDKCDGIVFIDEIDSHLHPQIVGNVVDAFQKTFPNIQFVISTHSPLVLINFNTGKIINGETVNRSYKIDRSKLNAVPVTDVFGLDYNTGLRDGLNAFPRKISLSESIDKLVAFKYNNDKENYDREYNKVADFMGDAVVNVAKEVDLILEHYAENR